MNWDFRWLFLLIPNIILFLLIGLLNDFLGNYSLYLFPYALVLYYPSVILSLKQSLALSILSGIFADAILLLPINTCSILFPIFSTIIYCFQNDVKKLSEETIKLTIYTINFLLFLTITVILGYKISFNFNFFLSFGINAIASHCFIVVGLKWFIQLQQSVFLPNLETSTTASS